MAIGNYFTRREDAEAVVEYLKRKAGFIRKGSDDRKSNPQN